MLTPLMDTQLIDLCRLAQFLTCDASETGYGAHVAFTTNGSFVPECGNELQRCTSSSYWELMAVLLALKSFQSFIAEKKVTIFLRQSECSAYCSQWQLCGSFTTYSC